MRYVKRKNKKKSKVCAIESVECDHLWSSRRGCRGPPWRRTWSAVRVSLTCRKCERDREIEIAIKSECADQRACGVTTTAAAPEKVSRMWMTKVVESSV